MLIFSYCTLLVAATPCLPLSLKCILLYWLTYCKRLLSRVLLSCCSLLICIPFHPNLFRKYDYFAFCARSMKGIVFVVSNFEWAVCGRPIAHALSSATNNLYFLPTPGKVIQKDSQPI